MDKYEFNLKVEQLKKLVKAGDYETAMKIADIIDWRRVSSISLLSMVSEIYEKNGDYEEAKEILLLAYDRAPVGKRILFKLAMLSLQEGNINEAENFYREFYNVASDDPRQFILRYLILKAKGAPASQLINSLEQYNKAEPNEKWMYELAETYYRAGRYEECVKTCDEIMLMFGIGQYVDKAAELKAGKLGQPLTDYQKNLLSKRDSYNGPSSPEYGEDFTVQENGSGDADDYAEFDREIKAHMAMLDAEMNGQAPVMNQERVRPEYYEPAPMRQDTYEPEIRQPEPEPEYEPVRQAEPEYEPTIQSEPEPTPEPVKAAEPEPEKTVYTVNFLVERRTPEAGIEAAKRLLKLMHEHTGSENKVAKIGADKLNAMGVMASEDKLAGKDLIVTEAGDLSVVSVQEIIKLIHKDPDSRVVILIDNPIQLKKMVGAFPELLNLFHLDREDSTSAAGTDNSGYASETEPVAVQTASVSEPVSQAAPAYEPVRQPEPEPAYEPVRQPEPEPAYEPVRQPEPEPAYEPIRKEEAQPAETKYHQGGFDDVPPRNTADEMGIDEFAETAAEYAKSIDCSISGKSMLALYERIEIMEEDGIPLTKENAIALIEEAADRAEKPPIGKKLASMFSPKYDKEDRLILREEHFIP